jgi:hypothetical protein
MKKILLSISMLLLAGNARTQERFADCAGALILCDQSDLIVKKLGGRGNELAEVGYTSCSGRLDERNSIWIKWQVGKAGAIGFEIEPLDPTDDLDFIVWRLDDDIRTCSRKYELRCMATGEDIGSTTEASRPCRGRMGLTAGRADTQEGDGCGAGHDNFLAAIDAGVGENYILYVNNYTSDKGFKLRWSGDAGFVAPAELTLPATDDTRMSGAVWFSARSEADALRTDWAAAAISKAFVGKVAGARVANAFAGCMPDKGVPADTGAAPAFELGQPYPNPTAANAGLTLEAPYDAVVRADLFDLFGRLVYTQEYIAERGIQILPLSTEQLRSGMYVIHLRAGESRFTRKLIVTSK